MFTHRFVMYSDKNALLPNEEAGQIRSHNEIGDCSPLILLAAGQISLCR